MKFDASKMCRDCARFPPNRFCLYRGKKGKRITFLSYAKRYCFIDLYKIRLENMRKIDLENRTIVFSLGK